MDEAPALFRHAQNLYSVMKSEAEEIEEGVFLWKGSLTRTVNEVVGHGYYSEVVNALNRMGCIHQKRRGTGGIPSEWYLQREPNLETFHKLAAAKPKRADRQEQQINDLKTRVNSLEKHIRNVDLELQQLRGEPVE